MTDKEHSIGLKYGSNWGNRHYLFNGLGKMCNILQYINDGGVKDGDRPLPSPHSESLCREFLLQTSITPCKVS